MRGRDPLRVRRLEVEEVPETGEGSPDSGGSTAELKELFTGAGAAEVEVSGKGTSLLTVVEGATVGAVRGLPAIYARWYSGRLVGKIHILLCGLLPPGEASPTANVSPSRADSVNGDVFRFGVLRNGDEPACMPPI